MCLQISHENVYFFANFISIAVINGERIDLNNSDDFVNNIYCLCSTLVFAFVKVNFKFWNISQSIKLLHPFSIVNCHCHCLGKHNVNILYDSCFYSKFNFFFQKILWCKVQSKCFWWNKEWKYIDFFPFGRTGFISKSVQNRPMFSIR